MQASEVILLVEDDAVDAMTVRRALQDVGIDNPMAHVTDGEAGLAYLQNSEKPRPGLILLDINMPRMNGIEFLCVIKSHDNLQAIPVVILTTSTNDHDIMQGFHLSVAGYMVKPVDYKQFVETVRAIMNYWKLSLMPEE
jgi:CheY-like chemotaxis protein